VNPFFEIPCEETDRQTNKHINAAENPTHAITIGVGNKNPISSASYVSPYTANRC